MRGSALAFDARSAPSTRLVTVLLSNVMLIKMGGEGPLRGPGRTDHRRRLHLHLRDGPSRLRLAPVSVAEIELYAPLGLAEQDDPLADYGGGGVMLELVREADHRRPHRAAP
jgi:hypothetical protein